MADLYICETPNEQSHSGGKHCGGERMLYCYAGRVNQVLMNLISNATDAIAREGKIVITTKEGAGTQFIVKIPRDLESRRK